MPSQTRDPVTVVVLTRDEERCIARCLSSLVDNGFHDVVVVDTGSVDATVQIVEAFADRGVALHRMEWPGGFAAARNAALDLVPGGWVAFVDADEWLAPGEGDRVREAVRIGATMGQHVALRPLIANTDGSVVVGPARILPAGPGLRYVGAVHEELRVAPPAVGEVEAVVTDLRFDHDGYEPAVVEAKDKGTRYAELLDACRRAEPDEPRWIFHHLSDALYDLPLRSAEALCEELRELTERSSPSPAHRRAEYYHGAGLRLLCRWYASAGRFDDLRRAGDDVSRLFPGASDPVYYDGVLTLTETLTDVARTDTRRRLDDLLLRLVTARRAVPDPEPGALHPFGLHLDTLIAAVLDGLGETGQAAQYRDSLDGTWTDAFFVEGRPR